MRYRWWHLFLAAMLSAAIAEWRDLKHERAMRLEMISCSKALDSRGRLDSECVLTMQHCAAVVNDITNRLYTCEGHR